jgi:hypothetical protein
MFSPEGPRPWHTKPGDSRLDAAIATARDKHSTSEDVKRDLQDSAIGGGHFENVDEKGQRQEVDKV